MRVPAKPTPTPIRTLVAFVTLISAVSTAAELPAAVSIPEVAVGESWIYAAYENKQKHTVTVEIWQLSDKEIHAVVTPNDDAALAQLQVFDRQWNHIETISGGTRLVKFSPYLPAFHFPLHIGKAWARDYEWQRSDLPDNKSSPKTWAESLQRKPGGERKEGNGQAQGRVLGWEEITVPAGTYTAMKVELKSPSYAGPETRRIFSKKEFFGGWLETYWYVPTVKRFVKYEAWHYINDKLVGSHGMDLVEYNQVRATPAEVPNR